MITATDMRAMRRALEILEGLDAKPADLRPLLAPREATVRLALEIATAGRGYLPADPAHAWITLWGWAIEGRLRAGAEMRCTRNLLEEFERQREGSGQWKR